MKINKKIFYFAFKHGIQKQILSGHYFLVWIRIRIRIRMETDADLVFGSVLTVQSIGTGTDPHHCVFKNIFPKCDLCLIWFLDLDRKLLN